MFGIIIIFLFYIIIFSLIPIEIKVALSYFASLYLFMYLFILSIASSVNLEANKSYKLFNSFYIKFRNTTKQDNGRFTVNQMKVNLLTKIIIIV